jgi:hypothetical protein
MEAKNIEQYFGTLQQSTVEAWRKHLKVSKKSQHETLNDFYEDIVDVVDKLIEDYMSIHGKVENYENLLSEKDMDALKYLETLREFTREGADELFDEDDTELFSDVDNILSVMDTAIYKLKELEESKSYKDLKDFINEQLVCEATKQIEFIASNDLADGFKFALTFDPNSDEDDYQEWDNNGVDPEWAWKNKSLIKKFCKVCRDVEKYCDYSSTSDLGNFPWDDSYGQMELLQDEYGASDGDEFAFITGDGDGGYFFVIQASDAKGIKAMNELTSLCTCTGGWDWETITFDSSELEY